MTESLSIHSKSVSTGTQLARNLCKQANAFMVDVLLSQRRAAFLAAFLGRFGPRALICDVCKGWSRGWTTARDEFGGRLVVLSKVDDVGCGWWFRLCPFW